jgi:hypothetical protein
MADRLQIKLLIISIFLSLASHSQNITDTSSLKKDFEKLLKKYGIKNTGYMISVNSINQKGGQTALVINNNYFGDTLSEKNNIFYFFDTIGSKVSLYVAPNKGIWTSPFVLTDTTKVNQNVYDFGSAFFGSMKNW